ncbi:MAG: galactose oxidase [Terriglobia bacterium]
MRDRIKSSVFLLAAMASLAFTGCGGLGTSPTPTPNPDPPPTSTANEWTWVSGSNIVNQQGSYGTLGTAAPGNVPGARQEAVTWTDAAGDLWLFGGAAAPVGGGCYLNHPLCWAGTNSFFNDLWKFSGNEWTWMDGSETTDQPGTYGVQGVADPANAPGARYAAVSWRDLSGNLWLFGGTGYDSAGNVGVLNDLWKYSGGQWTWVGGSNLINQPGKYGTLGTAAPGNSPGARTNAVGLADAAGNFWLFGGSGCDSTADCGGALNDLWEYRGGQWTWLSGTNVSYPAQPGVFGTEGTPAPGNHPGGRYSASGWMDASGNLWIFGGIGYNTYYANVAELNDLWKYGGGQWTWVSGYDNLIDQLGTYGTQGTAAPGNVPGSRDSAMSWTDAAGNLWLFGGEGFGSTGGGYLNDLWKFTAGEWTWVGGSGVGGQSGTYGTLGIPAVGNVPGARINAATWADAHGNLWHFGGFGMDSQGGMGYLNDLWEYQP